MTKIKVAHSYKTYEPVSMIPARGWCMVYACDDKRRYALVKELVAFVITKICRTDVYENGVEATNERVRIVGYVAGGVGIYPAEGADDFIGYLSPGARIPDHMEQRAKEYVLANEITKE
jgi:hypothetical protein